MMIDALVGDLASAGRAPGGQVWNKPPAGYMKLNWDASLDRSTKRMGMGGLVRT